MTERQRVTGSPAFVLHRRPYRDSSQIVELLTAEYGRLALVARGVRAARSRQRPILQPFQPLVVGWTLRGELGTLTAAESTGGASTLAGDALHSAFYVNELVLKLTHRHDPQPRLFELYRHTLAALGAAPQSPQGALRRFELRLLAELGYGLALDCDGLDGLPLDASQYYRVSADNPPMPVSGPSQHDLVFRGEHLLAVAAEAFESAEVCRITQRITRAAIDRCLDGKTLNTRKVMQAMRARRWPEEKTS